MLPPRPEHPDPLLVRDDWLNLNGEWDFAADPRGVGEAERWYLRESLPDRIVVPFCVESEASGANQHANARHFWYLRRFTIPESWRGKQIFLRLGAADYRCMGYVNGAPVGVHDGGFTPMTWRIDQALRAGENVAVLHVVETRDGRLPRGKQTHLPFRYAVFYRPFSGIWQTVWLEARGATHVAAAHGVATADGFVIHVTIGGEPRGELTIALTHPDGEPDAAVTAPVTARQMSLLLTPQRKAWWSPDQPQLYTVEYTIRDGDNAIDRATGYAGLRTIAVRDGRVLLNGEPFYQKLVLYQAYYPRGWATAIDDDTLRADMELIKSFGFNGLRVHQTLADPRLLYWCDRLGLVVWGEMPSAFVLSRVDRPAFERMLREAVARDRGRPCVITWVLFNESWGILDILLSRGAREWVRRMVALCREIDPSRPVIDNSGFDHLDTDVLDVHHYLTDPRRIRELYAALAAPATMFSSFLRNLYFVAPNRFVKSAFAPGGEFRGQPVMVSECGGHGFGPYGGGKMTLADSLAQVIDLLAEHPHLQGFAYTQFCDVEQERNGLCDFARQPKIDPADVRRILAKLPRD